MGRRPEPSCFRRRSHEVGVCSRSPSSAPRDRASIRSRATPSTRSEPIAAAASLLTCKAQTLGLSSAECAVDADFSQRGLEDGEFWIVEPLDE
jgi:hypothetical protein